MLLIKVECVCRRGYGRDDKGLRGKVQERDCVLKGCTVQRKECGRVRKSTQERLRERWYVMGGAR